MSYSTLSDKERRRVNAKRQLEKINRGQQGEDTTWRDVTSTNRHERRRVEKAKRFYDRVHGDGAADALVARAVDREDLSEEDKSFLREFASRH
jgi:hypothetical protein